MLSPIVLREGITLRSYAEVVFSVVHEVVKCSLNVTWLPF